MDQEISRPHFSQPTVSSRINVVRRACVLGELMFTDEVNSSICVRVFVCVLVCAHACVVVFVCALKLCTQCDSSRPGQVLLLLAEVSKQRAPCGH